MSRPGEAEPPPAPRPSLAAWTAGALLLACWIAAPFAAAGSMRWTGGWLYLAILAAGLLAHRAAVASRNPDLAARRARIGKGTARWDLIWLALFWPLMLAAPVAAGIHVRLGGASLPAWLVAPGTALFGAGMGLSAWAMAVNPYFEGTARLQPDQRVVDAGPYRRIRHPGYAGLALWAASSPLLLRSRAAAVPAALGVSWVVVRTALEDRMLRRGLSGYANYARRVRWRLVPGLW